MYKLNDQIAQVAFFSGDLDRSRSRVCDFCVGGEDGFDGGEVGPSAPSRAANAL